MKHKLCLRVPFIISIYFLFFNVFNLTSHAYQLTPAEAAKVFRKGGFPPQILPMITCVSKNESSFRPHIHNKNSNGTVDYGIMQINTIWLKPCHATKESILDAYTNAKCAYLIFQKQGITAWVGFNRFRSTCMEYKIPKYTPPKSDEYYDIAKSEVPL